MSKTRLMRVVLALCTAVLVACAEPKDGATGTEANEATTVIRNDLLGLIQAEPYAAACFVLRAPDGTVYLIGDSLAKERFVPASTFKVPHALLALQYGVFAGADSASTLRPYLGQHAPNRPETHKPQTLRSAIRQSVLWYFQDIADSMGIAREREGLQRIGFGNAEPGDETTLRTFWLTGPLAISPLEQTVWWARFMAGKLPIDSLHIIAVQAQATYTHPMGTMVYKTGWGVLPQQQLGWLVGALQHHGGWYTYAYLQVYQGGNGVPDGAPEGFAQQRFTARDLALAALLQE